MGREKREGLVKILFVVLISGLLGGQSQEVDAQRRIERLKSKKADQRREVLQALSWSEEFVESDLAVLMEFLQNDESSEVRTAAASTLGNLGAKAEAILPQLLALTHRPNQQELLERVQLLGRMGIADEEVIRRLESLAVGDNREIAEASVVALIRLGADSIPALTRLIASECTAKKTLLENIWPLGASSIKVIEKALEHSNQEIMAQGVSALGHLEFDDSKIDETLLRYLRHSNPLVRSAAVEAIGKRVLLQPRFIEAVAALAGDQDEPLSVRRKALGALGHLGKDAHVALGTLKRILDQESDTELRLAALNAWDEMGVEWSHCQDVLSRWISSKNNDVETRIEIARFLRHGVPESAFSWLVDMTRSQDERLREECCWALQIGGYHNQAEARKVLLALARDRDDSVREAAIAALRYHSTEKTKKALRRALRDKHADVRCEAIWGLANAAKDSSDLTKWIRPCLKDKVVYVRLIATIELLQAGIHLDDFEDIVFEGLDQNRYWSFSAIDHMKEIPDSILEKLRRMTRVGTKRERLGVLRKLCRYGTLSDREEAWPYLQRMLQDGDVKCRCEALAILAGFEKAEVFEIFRSAYEDKSWRVRWEVANSVPRVGGPECLELLNLARSDPQPWVRSAAIGSLCEVAPTDRQVMKSVLAALQDQSSLVRYFAAISSAELDRSMGEIDEALQKVIKQDSHDGVRAQARNALGRRTGNWR